MPTEVEQEEFGVEASNFDIILFHQYQGLMQRNANLRSELGLFSDSTVTRLSTENGKQVEQLKHG